MFQETAFSRFNKNKFQALIDCSKKKLQLIFNILFIILINQRDYHLSINMLLHRYLLLSISAQVILKQGLYADHVTVSSTGKYLAILKLIVNSSASLIIYKKQALGYEVIKINNTIAWFVPHWNSKIKTKIYQNIEAKNFKPQFSQDQNYIYYIDSYKGLVKANLSELSWSNPSIQMRKFTQMYNITCKQIESCTIFANSNQNIQNQVIIYDKIEKKFFIINKGSFLTFQSNQTRGNLIKAQPVENSTQLSCIYENNKYFTNLVFNISNGQFLSEKNSSSYCQRIFCFSIQQANDNILSNGFVRSKNEKLTFTLANFSNHQWVSQSFSKAIQTTNKNYFAFSFFLEGMYYIEVVTNLVPSRSQLSYLEQQKLFIDLEVIEKDYIRDFDMSSNGKILAYLSQNKLFVIEHEFLKKDVVKCQTQVLYFIYCNDMQTITWITFSLTLSLTLAFLSLFICWAMRTFKKNRQQLKNKLKKEEKQKEQSLTIITKNEEKVKTQQVLFIELEK